jgi:hypothetical protein
MNQPKKPSAATHLVPLRPLRSYTNYLIPNSDHSNSDNYLFFDKIRPYLK